MAQASAARAVWVPALRLVMGLALLMLPVPVPAAVGADWRDACEVRPPLHRPMEERTVAIDTPDGQIAGTLAGPADAPPAALVLMLHGYTGARNEIPVAGGEGMFARAARAFAERGIASLRMDFIGSGQSDGEWADTRFSGQARDAIRGAAWLQAAHGTDVLPLGVLGYSQGGLVALRAAAVSDPFDRMALWNPVMDPMATYGIIFGREQIVDGARQHGQGTSGSVVEGTRLRTGFFAELVTAEPISDAAQSNAPILIVTGRRDPLVENGNALAQQIAGARTAETVILDLDAGHDLGAVNTPALLDAVISCTSDFLLGEALK
ncbi:MAG: alpha/beta fold hydrolase [Pseudomonadota bacterium]